MVFPFAQESHSEKGAVNGMGFSWSKNGFDKVMVSKFSSHFG